MYKQTDGELNPDMSKRYGVEVPKGRS
jgi:hypothetical protein